MTTTPENVEKAFDYIDDHGHEYEVLWEASSTLRAHIEAQAAEIARLRDVAEIRMHEVLQWEAMCKKLAEAAPIPEVRYVLTQQLSDAKPQEVSDKQDSRQQDADCNGTGVV